MNNEAGKADLATELATAEFVASPKRTMVTHNSALQKVQLNDRSLGKPYYETSETDLRYYLTRLLEDIIDNTRSQTFKLDDNGFIKKLLEELIGSDFNSAAVKFTERLLNCEIEKQDQLGGFTKLRDGSLLCCHFTVNGEEHIVLVKVDHADFLNEATLMRSAGLPEKQRAQKCATFKVIGDQLDPIVVISDSSPLLTEYWWNAFLCLTPLSSPETNTLKSFLALESLLKNRIQPKSKTDYWTLRNSLVGYYTTREQCSFPDMIDELFSGYKPDSLDVSMEKLIAEAKELPKKGKGFDTLFSIAPKIIKARIKRQINLAENVDLRITGEINDFTGMFNTGEDAGRKYLKIYSDQGYEAFHRKASENEIE
ncbi:nucleoid-associated protein [Pseudomonas sp. PD9R]|uniref:nucleoid-associated protein n=1 Tax=Pseudomonas sp. PD9R TaxID=2853534 RepID=UPI001C464B09|nr:nucleoid-associated protein [Pseudomonas sp. PD9R]MBV6822775.1 nucleoid-associated protein [Pseudomonas sp. PD9R]